MDNETAKLIERIDEVVESKWWGSMKPEAFMEKLIDSREHLRALQAELDRVNHVVGLYQKNYKNPNGRFCCCTFDDQDNVTTECAHHLEVRETLQAENARLTKAIREILAASEWNESAGNSPLSNYCVEILRKALGDDNE